MSKATFRRRLTEEIRRPRRDERRMRRYVPPNDEQLAGFMAAVLGATDPFHRGVITAALEDAAIKAKWLRKHREYQEVAWAMEKGEQSSC